MRLNEFIAEIQRKFNVQSDHATAKTVAAAMHEADSGGSCRFTHEGVMYEITAEWYDGCISGDCNPATCWTCWALTIVTPDE